MLHSESLAQFGGAVGLRDEGLLDSALSRPVNKHTYEGCSDAAVLAAAYGYGLARNHPFVDGNKRAAFLAVGVFLTALFIEDALEFSAFPAFVLIATLLRLSLNVASTRVVLLNGHTGPDAAGRVTVGDGPHFWSAPFEVGGEFGGLGFPAGTSHKEIEPRLKGGPLQNTTLAVVVTDAKLSKAQTARLGSIASAGLARAVWPVYTPLDGDIVFTASTGRKPIGDPRLDLVCVAARKRCLVQGPERTSVISVRAKRRSPNGAHPGCTSEPLRSEATLR